MNRTLTVCLAILAVSAALIAQSPSISQESLKGLPLRTIGPDITTGRISDIEIDPKNPNVWYVASASGGLFKTENRGNTFTSIFDEGGSYSLGAVVVDPKDSNVVWLATGENNNQRSVAFGDGVYKSTDAGKTWKRMGLENSEHIQKILIDPRNSNVVYVTAAGPLWRSGGDRGLYKTTDGGATWKAVLTVDENTGAQDAIMDPKKPDTLYVAMIQRRRQVGQLIGGGPGSGLYKTTDGGAHFTKLSKGLPTVEMGRMGLGLSLQNPNIVYAIIAAQRGQGGFFRSDDAGTSWTRIGHEVNEGGRGRGGAAGGEQGATPAPAPACQPIGAAPAAPAAEAPAAGAPQAGRGRGGFNDDCFRGGDPGYYDELFVDPQDANIIYITNTNLARSEDGGKTWRTVPLQGVHVDYHEVLWDPSDHRHMLVGNDGGVYESYDNMKTWRHFVNLPLSQFYRISTDNAAPFYHVCGGAQDNGSVCGPSRTLNRVGIRTSDWYNVGGGDGFQGRVDPEDPNIVYAQSQEGGMTRLDLRTGISVGVHPRANNTSGLSEADMEAEIRTNGRGGRGGEEPPAGAQPPGGGAQAGRGGRGGGRGGAAQALGRWHWDAPFIISPHAARRLYIGGDRVYRSDDRGDTWTAISGDLTRNLDPTKIEIMGKLWPPDSVAFNEATTRLSTITALDESPLLEGLIYAGTDDGVIQVTEDGGKTWRKIDPVPGVPEFTYVTDVQPSARDVNTVFATFNDWNRGNFKPYVYKSTDRGHTWTSITGDLPARSGAWSIVQDPVNANLLFVGIEFGLYATVDGGQHWVKMAGVPNVQVRDVAIQKRDGDLVAGTFGRGVFILDDYSALREMTPQALGEKARLYPLRDAYQFNELSQMEASWGNTAAPNPPYGALLTYSIGQGGGDQKFAISIADNDGKQVRRLELCGGEETTLGLHRIAWDLRADTPNAPSRCAPGRGGAGFGGGGGFGRGGGAQQVALGRYSATIGTVSGETFTALGPAESFLVIALPK
jgi:photosystem II stability/assembly factor-like uncharacterized protein